MSQSVLEKGDYLIGNKTFCHILVSDLLLNFSRRLNVMKYLDLRLICSVEESCEKALRDPSILEDFDLVIVISSESAFVKIILG